MGEGFAFYLRRNSSGELLKRATTHGLGHGYKWGEFIGTPRGDAALSMLNEMFREDDTEWVVIGEYSLDDEDEDALEDLAWNDDVRKEALSRSISCEKFLRMFDQIREMVPE